MSKKLAAEDRATRDDADRRERLASALRANLARRKSQARARRAGEMDARQEGIDAVAEVTRSDES